MIDKMLKKSEKFGEAEIFHQRTVSTIVRYNQDKIETGIWYEKEGYSIRLNIKGRIAQVSFNRESEFPKALKTCVKLAKFSKPVRGYHFPEKGEYQKVKTYSKDLANLGFEDLVDLVLSGLDGIKEAKASPMDGQSEITETTSVVANSNGVFFEEKANIIGISMQAKAKTGTGYDFYESGLLDFDPFQLGKNAGEEAVENSKAKKKPWNGMVALHPDAIDEFISYLLSAVDGDSVRKKTSPWTGKLGKRVLGQLTIIEDPWMPYLPGSFSSDDEGVPTQKKVIVGDGILHTFLYDTITAKMMGTRSTGNGFRPSYASPVEIDVGNIVIDFPEREDLDSLDNVLFVRSLMGFHNMNVKTGDFSLTLDHGVLRKSGEEIPVKGSLFVGNMYDMLSSVSLASKEDLRRGDIISPYLVVPGRFLA